MLFITGSEAHTRGFSEDAYALAAEPKQLVVVLGAVVTKNVESRTVVGGVPAKLIKKL